MGSHDDRFPPSALRALIALIIRGRNAEDIRGDLDDLWRRDLHEGIPAWRASVRLAANALGSAVSIWRGGVRWPGARSKHGEHGFSVGVGGLLNDLRMATRRLTKQRAFSLAAIGTLSIGIGATTAIFGALNAVLLEPLPYRAAENIYAFSTPRVDGRWSTGRITHAYVSAIEEGAPSVERAVAVTAREDFVVRDDGRNRLVLTQLVTQGFFEVFDVPMALGRSFGDADFDSPTAVISHGLWQGLFGGSPAAIGQVLRMGQGDYAIVGVAPLELDEPSGTDVWISFGIRPNNLAHSFLGYLRVAEGTDPSVLESELAGVMGGLTERYPQAAEGRTFLTTPLLTSIVGNLGPILVVVMAGAGIVLLLASVNVAVLVLARGRILQREAAVRAALGAGRLDLARHLLAEALVVASAGTAAGLALAWVCVQILAWYGSSQLPRLDSVPFDARVLTLAVATLAATTLLTGLVPSLRLLRTDVRVVLAEGGRTSGSRATNRVLAGFVVAEIALAILLVSGAGWMLRSYADLASEDLGFTPDRRLVFTALLTGTEWAPDDLPVQGSERWVNEVSPGLSPAVWADAVRERIRASDQVAAVGSGGTLPLNQDWEPTYYVSIAGGGYDPDAAEGIQFRGVDPSFFEAIGTTLTAGRLFEVGEPGVALVNETFVRRHLPGRNALEQALHFGFPAPNLDQRYEIVGVVRDVRYESVAGEAEPTFYIPFAGARQSVVVSTTLDDPTALIQFVRAEVAAVDPDVPVSVGLYEEIVGEQLLRHRVGLALMSLFALVSIAMAAVGIYGVIAHLTGQRTREIATRMALGAAPADVRTLLLRRSLRLALAGVVLGLSMTWVGGRLIVAILPEVTPWDPLIILVATLIVSSIALIAFLSPAVRASSTEPAQGL